MKLRNRSIDPLAVLRFTLLVGCLALGTAGAATATDYYVFGRVHRISSEDAANAEIASADLTGDGYPFVHVRVYDQGTGLLLGEADAGINGQYTVQFSLPGATPAPSIEVRAYDVVDGGSRLLPEAREGINLFPSTGGGISTGQLALVKVESDDPLEYGASGFRFYPGVGLVFTRVGKVEIPEISQTPVPTNPQGGLFGVADIASAARATELGVAQFRRAPFAGRLLIFGDFGLPGGIACPGSQVDWYQVEIEPVDHGGASAGPAFTWQDPMHKRRTQVTVLPTLHVEVTTEKIGPFNGFLDGDPDPNVVTPGTAKSNLYWVNRNEVGGITNTFYSFPDLRVNWVSRLYNGWYKLSLIYYQQVGTTGAGEPILHELPMASCFTSGVPTGDADDVALHQLYLRVDNHGLTARFDGIFLRNRTTGQYFAGAIDEPNKADAIDFNDEGLCAIMELTPDARSYDVEVDFTVRHEGGFLRNYSLDATANDHTPPIFFATDDFADNTTAADPTWFGTPATGVTVFNVPEPPKGAPQQPSGSLFDHRCVYDFDLVARSRLQDGYHWLQGRSSERAYFVEP